MCIHCLGHFSTLPLLPPSLPLPPRFQAEPILPLSLILFKRRHEHNKEDKVFLLVEIRIALYKESPSIAFMYKCVTTQVDSSLTDLYTGSWSHSRVDCSHFKVSVLVPLEWEEGDNCIIIYFIFILIKVDDGVLVQHRINRRLYWLQLIEFLSKTSLASQHWLNLR
jgi:hypothetical protein